MTIATRRPAAALAVVLAALVLATGLAPAVDRPAGPLVPVVVRAQAGAVEAAAALVERLGGTVGTRIELIDGFAARVPSGARAQLERSPAVHAVTPDLPVRLHAVTSGAPTLSAALRRALLAAPAPTAAPAATAALAPTTSGSTTTSTATGTLTGAVGTTTSTLTGTTGTLADTTQATTDVAQATTGTLEATTDALVDPIEAMVDTLDLVGPVTDPLAGAVDTTLGTVGDLTGPLGALPNLASMVHAPQLWSSGYTGSGIGVALIDSGVAPVEGLLTPGKVVDGPDLSFDSQSPARAHVDMFGHGTHMAGIIAGLDRGDDLASDPSGKPRGIAPGATVVNVKVAGTNGTTDVSQVLAAIDWVVQHRDDPRLNIRVLNLAFGTDGIQDYRIDPLAYAAEMAWHKGIVVVVAAGNQGYGTPALDNPAYDPYVIAVGASDHQGTLDVADDVVADFSSRGEDSRRPDLLAPGRSVHSLRPERSFLALRHPEGIVDARWFKGSGTSQAAAVVSGAAALLLQARPELTPDQVKALLAGTARPLTAGDLTGQGAGVIDVAAAVRAPVPAGATQTWDRATGRGSIDAARGSARVADALGEITGERDIFGNPWDGARWSSDAFAGASWSGGDWNGARWSGQGWSADGWSGARWSGARWSGASWSGARWSADSWSGARWSGASWSGARWSGARWSGASWSGARWSGARWSGASWSGTDWS